MKMEKQNLLQILSSVQYNKTDQNDIQFDKIESISNTSIPQSKLEYNNSSLDTDVKSILNDENDSIIDELFEKNKLLQARWSIMQQQLCHYQKENERIKQLLSEERIRAGKYQKKLSYIQQNQSVFEKLKQAYMSLKYNEQKIRNLVEVSENGTQTNTSMQDAANNVSFDTESQNTEFIESIKPTEIRNVYVEPGYMSIKKQDFNSMKDTVHTLQTLIVSQPLSTFVLTENKEAKYRKDIADLFMDNRSLKQLVVDQQIELDTVKQQISLRKTSKETSLLKKIIAKLERQMRNINSDKINSNEDYKINLNETERKIVEHISAKYELKLQQKFEGISEFGSSINTPIIRSRSMMTPSILPPPTSKRPSSVQTARNTGLSKTPRCSTPYYTPRSDGCDTYRSCDNDNI